MPTGRQQQQHRVRPGRTRTAESSPERDEKDERASGRVRLPLKRTLKLSLQNPNSSNHSSTNTSHHGHNRSESEAARMYFASNSEASVEASSESSSDEDWLEPAPSTPTARQFSLPPDVHVTASASASTSTTSAAASLPHAQLDSRPASSVGAGRSAQVLVERARKPSPSARLFAAAPEPPASWPQFLRAPSPSNSSNHYNGPSSFHAGSKRRASPSRMNQHANYAGGPNGGHGASHAYPLNQGGSSSHGPYSLHRAFSTPVHGGGRRFRLDILCEVLLLTSAMSLAAYRISSLPISDIIPPAAPLIILTGLMPFITLFRRSAPSTHLMVPFTDERGYRDRNAADDGFASGVGLPVLLAAGVAWDARVALHNNIYLTFDGVSLLPDLWRQSLPATAAADTPLATSSPSSVLLDSRIALLVLTTLNVYVLIIHLVLSRTILRINWLPLSNTKRFFGALLLSSFLSVLGGSITAAFAHYGHASPYINPLELTISSFIYQMSLYLVSRFARRGFTLGELAMTTAAGVSLGLEFWRITRARWLFAKVLLFPATFRSPTPLVLYQAVLIPGAFLTGFLLSPLLVLSRHIASKPSYRLRWPAEKERNRKLLAAASLLGVCGISVALLGGWVGWQLRGGLAQAWSWAARFIVFGGDGLNGMYGEFRGRRRWTRLALAVYWVNALFFAVAGWQSRLARTRKLRLANASAASSAAAASGHEKDGMGGSAAALREEKRPHHIHVSIDLRRKFFHAMAVIVFVPGIAFDVSSPLLRPTPKLIVLPSLPSPRLRCHWRSASSHSQSSRGTLRSTPSARPSMSSSTSFWIAKIQGLSFSATFTS